MDKILGISLKSNLTIDLNELCFKKNLVGQTKNQIKYNFSQAIPNPSNLSYVIVKSLNINDVKSDHS
ncbi:unnamed protein product [Paramecium sonneborni]|uniref:Uncharacterized protein n=1 Tax=Paramecium sonneborni TaxID=65129 RepID=A0A8S1RP15_9CILI|nr:unnamed protein product [Paramecium sonneborni]